MPANQRPWTSRELDRLEDLRVEGKTLQQIGVALSRSVGSVIRHSQETPKRLLIKAKWIAILTVPHTLQEAADRMGVTVAAAKKAKHRLKREGVPVVSARPKSPERILPTERLLSPIPYAARHNLIPLSEEQRELAASQKALKLAQRLAIAFGSKWPSLADDALSVAYVGLCEAARTFDPSKGAFFATHAASRINGAFLYAARMQKLSGYRKRGKQTHVPTVGYLGQTRPGQDESNLDGIEELGTFDDASALDAHDEVYHLTRKLPLRERRLLRMLFTRAQCQTYRGIARELGCHRSYVCEIVASAIRRLRKQMGSTNTLDVRGGKKH